jgi:hypothetical protein
VPGALDHDQIIVLELEAGRGKVSRAGAEQSPVDLVTIEVHRRTVVTVGAYLDGMRVGEVVKDFAGFHFFGKNRSKKLMR